MRRIVCSAAMMLAACSGSTGLCGEGADPVIVTGLNGVIDGVTPAVEIELRVPETCEVLDTTWMFWDEENETVLLGEEPTSGVLARGGVEVDEELIFFRTLALGVRLDYPDATVGPELTLAWFSVGTDLAVVDCAANGGALECAVRESP